MNQSKIMMTKMLFVLGLGLVTLGSSNAMDHNSVVINQKALSSVYWDIFLMNGQLNRVKTNKVTSKSEIKPKAKSKKPRPASKARNAEFFLRELNKQKNNLVIIQDRADKYQVEANAWKYKDQLKQQLADEKKRECVKFFARNSKRK